MSLSFTPYTGDGITRTFPFSFAGLNKGYLRDEDVVVEVDGTPVSFTLSGVNQVTLSSPPVLGTKVAIRRILPKEKPYSEFKRGNNLGQTQIQNSFLQQLYVVQEMLDGYFPEGFEFKKPISFNEQIIRGVGFDLDDPTSVLSVEGADERFVNLDGDQMTGELRGVEGTQPDSYLPWTQISNVIDDKLSASQPEYLLDYGKVTEPNDSSDDYGSL